MKYFAWVLDQDEPDGDFVIAYEITKSQYNEIIEKDPIKNTLWAKKGFRFNTHQSGCTGFYRNTVECSNSTEVESFVSGHPNIIRFPEFLPGDYMIN